jgi:hypothetical protein
MESTGFSMKPTLQHTFWALIFPCAVGDDLLTEITNHSGPHQPHQQSSQYIGDCVVEGGTEDFATPRHHPPGATVFQCEDHQSWLENIILSEFLARWKHFFFTAGANKRTKHVTNYYMTVP